MPITYHVVVPFGRDDAGNLVPLEPAEAPNGGDGQASGTTGSRDSCRRCRIQPNRRSKHRRIQRRRDPGDLWRCRCRDAGRAKPRLASYGVITINDNCHLRGKRSLSDDDLLGAFLSQRLGVPFAVPKGRVQIRLAHSESRALEAAKHKFATPFRSK